MVINEQQIQQLNNWLAETGELYIDLYWPYSGGGGVSYFLHSTQELEGLITQQKRSMVTITIFRRLHFPIRGIANNELLERALQTIPNSCYRVLVVSEEGHYPYPCNVVGIGDSHEELKQEFPEFSGQLVGIGQDPFDLNIEWIEQSPSEVMVLKLKKNGDQYQIDSGQA